MENIDGTKYYMPHWKFKHAIETVLSSLLDDYESGVGYVDFCKKFERSLSFIKMNCSAILETKQSELLDHLTKTFKNYVEEQHQ